MSVGSSSFPSSPSFRNNTSKSLSFSQSEASSVRSSRATNSPDKDHIFELYDSSSSVHSWSPPTNEQENNEDEDSGSDYYVLGNSFNYYFR